MHPKFYICSRCGNLVYVVRESGVPMMCCGQKMTLLEPNSTDASVEKHKPVVTVIGDEIAIEIGASIHPMTVEHHIQWVYLETSKGGQIKFLDPTKIFVMPEVNFTLCQEKAVAVYAYCNLHGLWKTEL